MLFVESVGNVHQALPTISLNPNVYLYAIKILSIEMDNVIVMWGTIYSVKNA